MSDRRLAEELDDPLLDRKASDFGGLRCNLRRRGLPPSLAVSSLQPETRALGLPAFPDDPIGGGSADADLPGGPSRSHAGFDQPAQRRRIFHVPGACAAAGQLNLSVSRPR